jgi:exodeoxyribonuclease VIII
MSENLKTIVNGIFDGFTAEEYHSLPAANKSGMDKINKSPAHYIHEKLNPTPPTPAMVFGSSFHDALLLPAEFPNRYVAAPKFDKRTNAGKAAAAEFEAANVGKTLVDPEEMESIKGMADAIKAHPEASKFLAAGTSELSCFWNDAETGVLCKARPDLLLDNGTIVDIKTTNDASFSEFQKSIANFRYHVQAAWYLDGVKKFQPADSFVFVAVEKKPPYAVAVYMIDEASIEKGREEYRKNLKIYAECLKTGVWPAYSEELQIISIPFWSF